MKILVAYKCRNCNETFNLEKEIADIKDVYVHILANAYHTCSSEINGLKNGFGDLLSFSVNENENISDR